MEALLPVVVTDTELTTVLTAIEPVSPADRVRAPEESNRPGPVMVCAPSTVREIPPLATIVSEGEFSYAYVATAAATSNTCVNCQ